MKNQMVMLMLGVSVLTSSPLLAMDLPEEEKRERRISPLSNAMPTYPVTGGSEQQEEIPSDEEGLGKLCSLSRDYIIPISVLKQYRQNGTPLEVGTEYPISVYGINAFLWEIGSKDLDSLNPNELVKFSYVNPEIAWARFIPLVNGEIKSLTPDKLVRWITTELLCSKYSKRTPHLSFQYVISRHSCAHLLATFKVNPVPPLTPSGQ